MNLSLSLSNFLNDNLNLIMVIAGFVAIVILFLILALDRKRVQRLERDRLKKLQEDKLLSQEMEQEFANAINLSAEDVEIDEKQIKAKNQNVLANMANQKAIDSEDTISDFFIDGEKEIDYNYPEIEPTKQDISEKMKKEKMLINNARKQKVKEEKEEKVVIEEQKPKKKTSEPIKEEVEQVDKFEEEQSNVLDNYETVIKESDAMLEAMQSIIDTNIEEMQQLQKEPIDVDNTKTNKRSTSIVSKYKVLYDKVKKDWVVKKEGATRATKRCKSKEEAIDFAKKCTIDAEIGNTFHQKDGKFQKRAKK